MTVLSADTLRILKPVEPFTERTVINGLSGGVSLHGYDIHVREDLTFYENDFHLASSIEFFQLPPNIVGRPYCKSTWARKGVMMPPTVIEAGWSGYLTLELFTTRIPGPYDKVTIKAGTPIAQILFEYTDQPTEGYNGKYQGQGPGPVEARFE